MSRSLAYIQKHLNNASQKANLTSIVRGQRYVSCHRHGASSGRKLMESRFTINQNS